MYISSGGDYTVVNCTFSGNWAQQKGGGIYNYSYGLTLTNCTFSNNSTSLFGGDAIQYVLEVNAGMVEKLGIKIGAQIKHPVIGDGAAWGC